MPDQPTTVKVTVDGNELEVAPGTLVIRAAEQIGIVIPRFCDHRLLAPLGACRQCLVEVEGQRKLLTACTTTVTDGMVVKTQETSAVARAGQESTLEFLLINHPLDCPMCDKGGECPLQDQTLAHGPGETRFIETKRRYEKPIKISETVLLDRERCVLCARCTRFSAEVAGDPFIELFERGSLEQVAVYEDEPYKSHFSGNVVQICPVGALTSPSYRFQARPFDLSSAEAVCNHCASGCKLRTASWSEALRRATDAIRAGRGRGAGVLVGGHLSDQDAYAMQKLARVTLHSNNVDARSWPGSAAETAVTGALAGTIGPTYADLDGAAAVVKNAPVPVVAVGARPGRLAEFATVVATVPGGQADALGRIGKGQGDAGKLLREAAKARHGGVVVLAGWRAAASGGLAGAARLASALGGRLAWVPRRAGDRGALDAGARPDLLPGGRAVDDADARRELGEAWGAELAAEPGLDAPGMLRAAADGELGLLVLAGVDLVRDHGPRELVERALANAFVIAVDHELNETTRHAEVLLPGVVHAETDGTFTDWEGRVQGTRHAVPVGGAAQTIWELADQLSLRLKVDLGLGNLDAVVAETARWRARPAGAAVSNAVPAPEPAAPTGPDDGLALVTYPLLLDGASLLARAADLNRSTEEAFCELHPDDAARLGLAAGGRAALDFGDGATAELPVRVSAGVAPGCVFVPSNQPDLALGALLGPAPARRVALRAAGEVAA